MKDDQRAMHPLWEQNLCSIPLAVYCPVLPEVRLYALLSAFWIKNEGAK
jgi:hypothetical protein